jgi:sulfide:quinone oxidoreductase
MMANHLRRRLPASEWCMTVVDRSDKHLYQPEFFFLPFDKYNESGISRQTRYFMHRDAEFIL